MKHILALCLLIPSLLIAVAAHATDVTVACKPPALHIDGTPITGALSYKLFGALQGQEKQLRTLAPLAQCTSVRKDVQPGVTCWDWTAVEAIGTTTSESAHSTEQCSTVAAPVIDTDGDGIPDATDACPAVKGTLPNGCNPSPPMPPTDVTATTVTAYEYRPGTKTFVDIGLVPEGVTCGPETLTSGTKTYCRVKLADSLPVVWPKDRTLREVWVIKPAGSG